MSTLRRFARHSVGLLSLGLSAAAVAQGPTAPAAGLESWAEPLYANLTGTSYSGYVASAQDGVMNSLDVEQAALAGNPSNVVLAMQNGYGNHLTITQYGSGNVTQVLQSDGRNEAIVKQSGGDQLLLAQYGSENYASINGTGGNNAVTARQYADRNSLTVNLPGNVQFNVVQNGGASMTVNGSH